MFAKILEIREELLPESKKNIELADVYMAFGQLYYITKKYIDSKLNFEQALKSKYFPNILVLNFINVILI